MLMIKIWQSRFAGRLKATEAGMILRATVTHTTTDAWWAGLILRISWW